MTDVSAVAEERRVSSPQWLRVVYAATSFIGFGLGGVLLSTVVLPLVWLAGGSLAQRRRRCQRIVASSFRLFLGYMRVCGLINVSPRRLPDTPTPSVVVANHPTLIDVTAILAAQPEICCVVKPSIALNPMFWAIVKLSGHVSGASGTGVGSSLRVFDDVMSRIAQGHSVLVFVEGTRSPPYGVLPFQRGAFEIARRARVPVVPLVLESSPPVLKKGTPWYAIPTYEGRLRIDVLEPIVDHLETEERSSKEMAIDTRRLYVERLGEPEAMSAASNCP